ncbi:hypothetical protein pb186bvf_014062 [Paramecium bursaria]
MSGQSSDFSDDEEFLLKGSNIFKNSKNSNSCPKHPSKRVNIQIKQFNQAKYYIAHDKRSLFCSKCALNLALKGLKIEETSDNPNLELLRQKRISTFQESVVNVLENSCAKIQEFEDQEQLGFQVIQDSKDNCLQFFDIVIATTNQLKQTYLQKIQTDYQQQVQNISDNLCTMRNLSNQLKQFQIDIEKNHENIVRRMEMKPFDEIMQRYEKKVNIIKQQVNEINCNPVQKSGSFDQSQILTYMNKMCYNLLLKQDSENATRRQSIKNSDSQGYNKSIDMRVFEILECEDIYQSTCSNPIQKDTSPNKQQKKNSNPVSSIQNSRRESNMNTPESWQQRQIVKQTNTPNEQFTSQKQLQQLNVIYRYPIIEKEKQKTISEIPQPLIQNLSQLQENRYEDERQLTPKQQKISQSKHSNQKSAFQLIQQCSQKDLPKQYESLPKSLTPHHTMTQQQVDVRARQDQNASRRSNSKISKQQSMDEGKRQFILQNIAQYTTQQPQNEESLKDRIFKELCQHPGDSVYNQVLKNNKNKGKYINKENNDWSSTLRKNNQKKQ